MEVMIRRTFLLINNQTEPCEVEDARKIKLAFRVKMASRVRLIRDMIQMSRLLESCNKVRYPMDVIYVT